MLRTSVAVLRPSPTPGPTEGQPHLKGRWWPPPRLGPGGGEGKLASVVQEEVAPGIHRLSGGICNFYLIEQDGKLVLVDAGAPKDWRVLVAAVAALGRQPKDLDAILLTHAHPDHTGFAERARASAGSTVWVHGNDVAAARTGKTAESDGALTTYLLHAEFYRTVISLVRRGAARIVPIRVVSSFSDGETIDVPGCPRAVHVPGHSPGSAALLIEDRGVVLTGDTLVTRNPLTGRVGPQIMPSGLNADTDQALRSVAVFESLTARILLPGHGEPWTDGAAEAARLARAAGRS